MTDSEKLDLIINELGIVKTDVNDIKSDLSNVKTDLSNVKSDLNNVKSDLSNVKSDLSNVKSDLNNVKSDLNNVKSEMSDLKNQVIKIQLHIEDKTDRNIELLAENHITLIDKLNQAIPAANKNLAYEVKVNYLLNRVSTLDNRVRVLEAKG